MDSKHMNPIAAGRGEETAPLLPVEHQENGMRTALPEEQTAMPHRSEIPHHFGGQNLTPQNKNRFGAEVSAMLELYPELKDKLGRGGEIPREVLEICAKTGVTLRTAYAEYEVRQAKAEIERLRKENQILRQNAAAAAKAPVKGAAAGSSDTKGKDPFLEGLLSDD